MRWLGGRAFLRAVLVRAVLAGAISGLTTIQAGAQTREEVRCTYTRSELCLRTACQTRRLPHHPSLLLPPLAELASAGGPAPFSIQRCSDGGCRALDVSKESEGAYTDLFAAGYVLTVAVLSEPLSGMSAGDFVEVVGKSFLTVEVNYGHCPFKPRSK